MSYLDDRCRMQPQKGENGGACSSMVILAGQTYQISGITNANQLSFKRKDSSNTQVVIRAEGFKI